MGYIQEVLNGGRNLEIPVKAGVHIEAGMIVAIKSGLAIVGAKTTGATAVGVAQCDADNRNGADGEVFVKVKRGTFKVSNSTDNPVTQVNLFDKAYFADAYSVTAVGTGSSVVGKILAIDDEEVIVEIM